jgi:hypothetical protein
MGLCGLDWIGVDQDGTGWIRMDKKYQFESGSNKMGPCGLD